MELVLSPSGILCFLILSMLYLVFARHTSLGALSLPCVTLLTSMVYFFVMPAMAFSGGNTGFLGVYIETLAPVHWAVLLYAIGASSAFVAGRRVYAADPTRALKSEREFNPIAIWLIVGIATAGLAALTAMNRLNLLGSSNFTNQDASLDFPFLQNALSMLLPITVVYAVRNNFRLKSMMLILLVVVILMLSGFRYRIAILIIALVASFALTRGFRVGVFLTFAGTAAALIVFNALGASRRYGAGIDFSIIGANSWMDWLHAFGGEVGPIFAFYSVIELPPPDFIMFDPWIIAIARLIPSFIWPDKPFPIYLEYYTSLFDENIRRNAGIAGPQQAEMLLQFGWFGLPFLSFFVFMLVTWLVSRFTRLGREGRIAGMALASGVFGFYMQQRGYVFQNFTEALFIIGPLFFMYKPAKKTQRTGRGI